MVAHMDGDVVRLLSRHDEELTARFPELAAALARLPAATFILDGEVAMYDRAHILRFEWLRTRPRMRWQPPCPST